MKVGAAQFDIAWEDPTANFEKVSHFVAQARSAGVDLLVLPEMFATGFSMNAESVVVHAAATRSFLERISREEGIAVLGGFAEQSGSSHFNTCSLFDKSGREVLHYRKIHPFSLARENEHYEAGESIETVVLEDVRITPFICYDLRFPEIFRVAAARTDMFCIPANWPTVRRDAWQVLLRARAIENQAYVLGVNRVGEASGHPHSGDSALLDPMGETIDSSHGSEKLLVGDVASGRVREVRQGFSFLADRRPSLYEKLESQS